jgi:ketosteroid isomerase-like protein
MTDRAFSIGGSMRQAKVLCVTAAIALCCVLTFAQSAHGDEDEEVRAALGRFIAAFDNLDWPRFIASFEDGATVCYPSPPNASSCAEGRPQFEPAWQQVFAGIRGTRTAPPYMDLKPERLRVRTIGDAAIVTFELHDGPGRTGRRTIVLHRESGRWRIAHLHASNVPTRESLPR